jgi:hypothetical protein
MTEPLTLTPEQKEALRALVLAVPAGLFYDEVRMEARRVFDSLVEVGAAVQIEAEGGRGYQLSPEMATAFGISAARKGAQAELN